MAIFASGAVASGNHTFFLSGNGNTQIKLSNSSFQYCGVMEDGGVFKMIGAINFTDYGSTF